VGRPTKITVKKVANGDYEITCIDEMTGSATGMQIPENGYEVLKHHFRTGVMEISSDELIALPIPVVVVPKGTLCKCGKQYEVYNKLEGTIVCTLCGKDRLA
jgi:hypothetical protein